ncbi:unnamed protein product [Blepharisma stoltei]|uniref:Uncharacterized protein n=1 Tax=Blepharisma stoltei TaxID=1481888 RepID=A0AAU9K8H0_9CILI|nr:unnamed protein product [Blepharisma stoltei]
MNGTIAPAYSLTGRRDNYNPNPVPGPGDYRIETEFYKYSSKHSFPQAPKLQLKHKEVPGPGSYEIPTTIGKGPVAVLSARTSTEKNSQSPGPGEYSPSIQEKLPAFSFGIKPERKSSDSPGPGHYDTEIKEIKPSPPKTKFGSSKKEPEHIVGKDSPGPGRYACYSEFGKTPKYGFGTSRREKEYSSTYTPGPGAYALNASWNEGPKAVLRAKNYYYKPSDSPGPGAYSPKDFSDSPGWSLGKSTKEPEYYRSFTPSPGQYEIKNFDSLPKYSLGKSSRNGLQSNITPGPGHYSPEKNIDKKKISIGKKWTYDFRSESPGPGKYSPNHVFLEKTTAAVFGTDKKLRWDKDESLPSPFEYDISLNSSKGGFSIPKAPKEPNLNNFSPGPGHYNISSTLGKAGLSALNKNI